MNNRKPNMSERLVLALTLLLAGLSSARADFVDEINATSNKYGYGHRVIYEMNVGGFTAAGTFAAAQAQLESLKLTGVDVIWLMPIYPRQSTSPGINSPYGPVSYTKTNPNYGTVAQLKSFVDRAHALNMEVWLDWVPNHTATNAEWATGSNPQNYYKYNNGSIVHPNNYNDVIQLDYSKQTLRDAMDEAMKYWIREAGIDGYRCDYVSSSEIPADYWTWQIPRLRNYATSLGKSEFWMLGEANFLDNSAKKLFGTGWDYDYMWNLFEPTLTGVGSGTDGSTLKTRLTNHFNQSEYSSLDRMAYLNNHDEDWNDKATMTSRYGDNRYAFNVLIFTFYGMPLIYNGQEIGYSQNLDYFNDTKINWNSVDNKMKNTIRTLTALKHNVEAFQDGKTFAERGNFSLFSTSNSVVAYKRSHGDSEAIVILNLGTSATTVSLTGVTAGSYELCLNSSTIASGVSKETVQLSASPNINVEARGYRVYVKGTTDITSKTYAATLEGSETAINKATFIMNATVDDNTDTSREVHGYYTTDGTEPTTNSTTIRHGDVITLTEDCTLKFRYRTNNQDETLSSTITKDVTIAYSTSENYSNYRNNVSGSGITVFLKTNHANPTIWGWKTDGGADLNPGETWPGSTVTNTTESGWFYKTFATNALTFKCTDNGANETTDVSITEDTHFLYVDGYLIKLDEYNQTADNKYVYFAQLGETDWANVSCYAWGWGTHNGNTVFVDDQTGWGDNLRLHCWYGDTTLSGSWPGWSATGTISYNGTNTYKYFDLGVSSGDQHLFFNNNGSNQIEYYNYNTSSNGLISLTSSSASLGTLGNAEPFGAWGSTGGRVLTKIGTLYDSTGNTHNVMRLDASGAIAGVNLIFNNNAQGTQAADASCEFGRLYYATTAISSSTSLSTLSLPNGTKQEESIDTHVIPPHINGDDTYLLSPTWTGSTTTKDNVVDWTGKSVTVNTPAQNTAVTQTVTIPTAGTYLVQAIVRATKGSTITLDLNGTTKTLTAIGMDDNTPSQVDTNGRVDKLYTGKTGGWQKIEHSITLVANATLTISLKSTANTGSFEFSDVTLLENPNTTGMFYTTAGTTETEPYADLTNVKKFSFFDRGENLNGLVRLSSSAVQAISGHEHPANVIISNGTDNVCDYLYLTDNDDSGASWNNRHAFATNVAFTAHAFSFDRTFPANQHVTLCLPFALTASELQSLFGTDTWYAYQGISDDGSVIRFEEKKNTPTVANQPMLLIPTQSGQLLGTKQTRNASVSPVSSVPETGFIPTYSWMEAWNSNDYVYYLFNTDGNCVKVGNDGFDTKPFRAYIKIPATSAKESMLLSIEQPQEPQEPEDDINEETTDIRSYNTNDSTRNIPAYNLAGQRVGNSYRGIVIINGKKIIR